MNVRDLVGGEPIAISPSQPLRVAATSMADANIGALAVVRDGRLIGIVTERDLVGALAQSVDADTSPVGDWMTMDPDSLDPEMEVDDAAEWMLAAGDRHLPVVDGVDLIGVVSIKDVLWALTEPKGSG
jgi:CBS domain-containing protein